MKLYYSMSKGEKEALRREWKPFCLIALGCLGAFAIALRVMGF